jgi:bifunctional enzyme CysN/CysC
VLTQSKRHGFLVSLLGIPHLVVAVNKMDLVDYAADAYDTIVADYLAFSAKLDIHDIAFFPVSALRGDNITARSGNMAWYNGHTLLHHLENVHVAADDNLVDFRFPVQNVVRPSLDFRGFAGRIASGAVRPGEEIVALPSGKTSRVTSIDTFDGPVQEAAAGRSVVLRLADEIDISRGDMIVRRNNLPSAANRFEAIVCWMDETPLSRGSFYLLRHTTHTVKAHVSRIFYTIDVNTLHRRESESLTLNEIARVELRTSQPLFFDPYRLNRATGAFVLIDPVTNNTAAGGMIRGAASSLDDVVRAAHPDRAERPASPHTDRNGRNIPRERREERQGHLAAVLWLTGLSGSGKSTIARALEERLFAAGCRTALLDGDNLRHGLCGDLGFSEEDRTENIRRAGEAARLFFENAALTICSFISPMRGQRGFARSLIPRGRFLEIYIRCDVEVCKRRDPRGLYEKARTGEIPEFTGVTSPYEAPRDPELTIDTDLVSVEDAVEKIMDLLREKNIANLK